MNKNNRIDPVHQLHQVTATEIHGNHWIAWISGENYFLDWDIGGFVEKFVSYTISQKEYFELKEKQLSAKDLVRICQNEGRPSSRLTYLKNQM